MKGGVSFGGVWIGGAALAASALVYVLLLARLRRAENTVVSNEQAVKVWWLGYARDGTNLAAFLVFSGAYHLLGLPGPVALLAGAVLALVGYGLDFLFARVLALPRATATTSTALIALVLLSTALREPLARGLRALIRGLF
jgi:hypothetical protein